MRRLLVCLFIAVCGACFAQTPAPREFARSVLLVQLRVGDAPGWALVDTGSPFTYVDVSFAPDLAAKVVDPKSATAKLWIGGKVTVEMEVRFLDLSPFDASTAKRPLIAILGRDFLGRFAMGVDLKRKMLRLWKGGRLPLETVRKWAAGREKGGMSIDVHDERLGLEGLEPLALDLGIGAESGAWTLRGTPVGGTPIELSLDTGSTFTSIHWKTLKDANLKPIRMEAVADVFGPTVRRVVALPELRLGVVVLRNMEVYLDDEGDRPDVLAPKDLGVAWYVIDPAARKLYVPAQGE